jgi:hypothetical protein
MRRVLALGQLVMGLAIIAPSAHAAEGELTPHLKNENGNPYGFVEVLPVGYAAEPHRRWPALLFLPGLSEVGDSASAQALLDDMTAHGPCKLSENGSTVFADAGVIVFCIQPSDQVLGAGVATMNNQARWLFEHYRIDPQRVYFTGLSAGGGGIWRWGADLRGGHRLAAQLNICGNADPFTTSEWDTTPTFIVQSWGDGTNPRSRPIGWANLIGRRLSGDATLDVMADYPHAGGDPALPAAEDLTATLGPGGWTWVSGRDTADDAQLRLTLYTDDAHDSWSRTYADDTVWTWMFAQARAPLPGQPADAVILDNLDPGTTFTGAWQRVELGTGFWGWDMHTAAGLSPASVTYSGTVPEAGSYELSLAWVPGADRHGAVPVTITHAGGEATVMVNMTAGDGFQLLGTYDFAQSVTVTIAAPTGGVVVADAVALHRVGSSTLPDGGPIDGDGGPSDGDGGPITAASEVTGGCTVGGPGSSAGWLVGLALLLLRRSRHRKP